MPSKVAPLGASRARIAWRCALPVRIRLRKSSTKPFIRLSATTSAAVPTVTPATLIKVIRERNVRPRWNRK